MNAIGKYLQCRMTGAMNLSSWATPFLACRPGMRWTGWWAVRPVRRKTRAQNRAQRAMNALFAEIWLNSKASRRQDGRCEDRLAATDAGGP